MFYNKNNSKAFITVTNQIKNKNMKFKVMLLLAIVTFSINAQSIGDYKDVVHFKNGSSIEGVIIEQIPGESIKIQGNDGKVYSFPVEEVARFTRELSVKESKNVESVTTTATSSIETKEEIMEPKVKWSDNFKLKKKGYFIEADLLLNTTAQGLRVTNGYKFGRFGMIGIAIGLEKVTSDYWSGSSVPEATINLVYSGEILNKRITPFYQAEVGYGFALNRKTRNHYYGAYEHDGIIEIYEPNEELSFGGPMGGITLGVKFKTKMNIVYKLGLDARIVSQFSERTSYFSHDEFNMKQFKDETFELNPGLGIRFGIGF
ncbi:MAG: hypothetical protein ACI8ZX_000268 [Planctomycetota bacterium]